MHLQIHDSSYLKVTVLSEVSYWLRNDKSTHPGFQTVCQLKVGHKKQISHISGYEPEKDIGSGKQESSLGEDILLSNN